MIPTTVTLGEIMLRLKSPGFERLFQSPLLEASFGGGEANVAASLACMGAPVRFVSALPQNPVGEAALRHLRGLGVDTSFIQRRGQRVGIYFLESGANQRPSQVIYDRAGSAVSEMDGEGLDWDGIFAGAAWLHVTGITPALSQNTADLCQRAMREAKARGLTVSLDYNYRKNLWKYGRKAPEVMAELMPLVDVGIANEEDIQLSLGVELNRGFNPAEGRVDAAYFEELCRAVFDRWPSLKIQTITLRESLSATSNGWSACLWDGKEFLLSRHYQVSAIVDRVGTGDSFAAGLIYGLQTSMTPGDALNFAAAASCLKHSIPGDMNISTAAEIARLAGGETSGRIVR